jgi:Zn-dependent peptidase ImmA (M78 family)
LLFARNLYLDLLDDTKIEILPFSISEDFNAQNIKETANFIRKFFALDIKQQLRLKSTRQFYLYLRKKIENKSIFINCFSGVDSVVLRGLAIYDEKMPIIGINENDRPPAKSFTIIHELTHILKKQTSICTDIELSAHGEEAFCNAVAGEVLVPEEYLNNELKTHSNMRIEDRIEAIANKFSVSKEVIATRMLNLGKISKDEYTIYSTYLKNLFEKEKEEQKIARQLGLKPKIRPKFSRKVIDRTSSAICSLLYYGYTEDIFTNREVSNYLDMKSTHFNDFIKEVSQWQY